MKMNSAGSYMHRSTVLVLASMLAMAAARETQARVWNVNTGYWHAEDSWTPAGVPGAGEDVTVASSSAVVLLTNETASLGTFSMTAGKVVFSNWTTRIRAANVSISGGSLTVASAFSQAGMSNRVWVVCTNNFTLTAPGTINVDYLGYLAANGPGQGAGSTYGGGAGHGGRGGRGYSNGGPVCDDLMEPVQPGSGGAVSSGGNGGGLVRIEAGGTVNVSGTLSANGKNAGALNSAGGAGGAVCIVAGNFTGTSAGLITANGGNAGGWRCGDGGGGRIAIKGGTVSSPLQVRFSTAPGVGGLAQADDSYRMLLGDWGTVYIADTNILAAIPFNNQFNKTELQVGSATNWSVASMYLTNNSLRLVPQGFQLEVAGNLTVGLNAELGVKGSIDCGGDLVLTNSGALNVYSGPTNGSSRHGATVDVAHDVRLYAGTWLRPHCDPTNGGGVLLKMRNLNIVATDAGINASGRGYRSGYGPGRGRDASQSSGGGGYGGNGGNGSGSAGGSTNGHRYAPLSCGSGGGRNTGASLNQGAYGGGLVHVQASRDVVVNGQILANGAPGKAAYIYCGGGAGGGILIECSDFIGSGSARLSAVGGDSGYSGTGSGGGGRAAVWYGRPFPPDVRNLLLAGATAKVIESDSPATYQGTISVTNGIPMSTVYSGGRGTTAFLTLPPPGTIIVIR